MNSLDKKYFGLLKEYCNTFGDVDYKQCSLVLKKVLADPVSIGKTPRGIVAGIVYACSKGVSQETLARRLDTSVPTIKKNFYRIEEIMR